MLRDVRQLRVSSILASSCRLCLAEAVDTDLPAELWTHASYMIVGGISGYYVVQLENNISQRLAEIRELRAQAKLVRAEREADILTSAGLPADKREALKIWKAMVQEKVKAMDEEVKGRLEEKKQQEGH